MFLKRKVLLKFSEILKKKNHTIEIIGVVFKLFVFSRILHKLPAN